MDLALTETQEMLRKTSKDFIGRECPNEVAIQLDDSDTGFSAVIWRKMAELGWVGMILPEKYGGMGATLTDLGVLYEQLGWAALPSPHLSSSVLCGLTILNAGSEEQKSQILPSVAQGDRIIAFAFTEPHCGWGPDSVNLAATQVKDGWVLSGTKILVHDVQVADQVLCVARTRSSESPEDGISLFLVDKDCPGFSWRTLSGFLGEKLNEVTFDSVKVPKSNVMGDVDRGWTAIAPVLEKATALICENMIGGCRRIFDITVNYCRTRVQFGVHIGTFQRVQDHMINIANGLEAARWTTYQALWKLDEGWPAAKEVSLAKAVTSEAYYDVCQAAHDVHAGAGIMKDYPLHLHTKKSRTLYHYLGDPAYHKMQLAQLLEL